MDSAHPWVICRKTGGASPASCASPQRAAHSHHRSPARGPGRPCAGARVTRSSPWANEYRRNGRVMGGPRWSFRLRQRAVVETTGMRLGPTQFERAAEHLAGRFERGRCHLRHVPPHSCAPNSPHPRHARRAGRSARRPDPDPHRACGRGLRWSSPVPEGCHRH